MKSITIKFAGLCLVALAAVAMATAATASAAPVWEQCTTEKTTVTKYTENKCLTASSTGAWGWKEVTGTEKVTTEATLDLRDKSTLLGEVEVQCSGTDEGSIGPKTLDRITTITVLSCTNKKNCSGTIVAKAVNLPWNTELTEKSGTVRDLLKNAGKAASEWPGWEVSCSGLSDKCTTNSGSTLMENTQSNGTVQAIFEKESGKAECTAGLVKESGEVAGTVVNRSAAGHAIRVS
jgi:hypothetical protein